MKNKIIIVFIISLLISTILFPVVNSQYRNKNIVQVEEFETDGNEIAVIQIGGDRQGNGGKKIEIPLSEALRIQDRFEKLIDKVDAGIISSEEFAKEMLTILREENILPSDCTYDNFMEIVNLLKKDIDRKKSNKFYFNPFFIKKINDKKIQNIDTTQLINPPFAMGGLTFWGSLAVGGVAGSGINFGPWFIEPIFNETILDKYEIISYMAGHTAVIQLPGVPGYHFAFSALPIPGLEAFTQGIWVGTPIFAVHFFSVLIGVYGFVSTDIPVTLFDLVIGISTFSIIVPTGFSP